MSTATQVLAVPRNSVLTRACDYAELTKLRVTTLIVMTAWCGYYFGALKSGSSSLSWRLFHALLNRADCRRHRRIERVDGVRYRQSDAPHSAASPSRGPNELAARWHCWWAHDDRRRSLSRPCTESADRMVVLGHIGCLPRGLHTPEEDPPDLHVRRSFPRGHARRPRLDGRTRAPRLGGAGDVRHRLLLAVSTFLLDRLAISRRLRSGQRPHAACCRSRRQVQ